MASTGAQASPQGRSGQLLGQATQLLRHAHSLQPQCCRTLTLLAQCTHAAGKATDALSLLDQAEAHAEAAERPVVRRAKANMLTAVATELKLGGRLAEAVQHYQGALVADATHAPAYYK